MRHYLVNIFLTVLVFSHFGSATSISLQGQVTANDTIVDPVTLAAIRTDSCSAGFASQSSSVIPVNLNCSLTGDNAFARLTGHAGEYQGSIAAFANGDTGFGTVNDGFGRASADLSLFGSYIFGGGSGTATISLLAGKNWLGSAFDSANLACVLTLGGTSVDCGGSQFFGDPFQFQIEFGKVYDLSLSASLSQGEIYRTGGTALTFAYDFAPGNGYTITSVPEPSSLLLLGTGALGLFGRVRRKLLR